MEVPSRYLPAEEKSGSYQLEGRNQILFLTLALSQLLAIRSSSAADLAGQKISLGNRRLVTVREPFVEKSWVSDCALPAWLVLTTAIALAIAVPIINRVILAGIVGSFASFENCR